MPTSQTRGLRYVDRAGPADRPAATIEFVGGPRNGERRRLADMPSVIAENAGSYRRSVRCADDGALRYVYEEDPAEVVHERLIRPS
jgi:hypothetical protein